MSDSTHHESNQSHVGQHDHSASSLPTQQPPGIGTDKHATPFPPEGLEIAGNSPPPIPQETSGVSHRVDRSHSAGSNLFGFQQDASIANPGSSEQAEMLYQAGQIADQLRAQFDELNRRERSLNEQLAAVDQERRSMRLWAKELQSEIDVRRAQLAEEEEELRRRKQEQFREAGQLQTAQVRIVEEREQLQEELEQELEVERRKVDEEKASLVQQQAELSAQIEKHQTEHEQLLREARETLDAERTVFLMEYESGKAKLEEEQSEWFAQSKAERERMVRERREHEETLEYTRRQIETLKAEQEEIADRKTGEVAEKIELQKQEFQAEVEQVRAQLKQQQTTNDNRFHFQEEHLRKTRQELESARSEYLRQCQLDKMRFAERESILDLRRRQLEYYRLLLEEREMSVQREQQLVQRKTNQQEDELAHDRLRLRQQREQWERLREAQQSELRRQQDMLALHAQNLEDRKSRLDELRTDMEATHRETLEMRIALEEAWARLNQQLGEDNARERVQQLRDALSEHYRSVRESISRQRAEVEEACNRLLQQRDEFRAERQTLTEFVNERENELQTWEAKLHREMETLDTREEAWRAARDRWSQEKIDAEEVIRDLLRQLTDLNSPGHFSLPEAMPSHPQSAVENSRQINGAGDSQTDPTTEHHVDPRD